MVGSQQGVPSVDRFGTAGCQGVNSSRGILSSHSHMSPESVRLLHRHRSVPHRDAHLEQQPEPHSPLQQWYMLFLHCLCPQPSEPPGLDPSLVVLPVVPHVQWGRKPRHHDWRPDGGAPRGGATHAGKAWNKNTHRWNGNYIYFIKHNSR